MNKIVISRPVISTDIGKIDAAFYVVNTPLSVSEFDTLFRQSINEYLAGWKSFVPMINEALEASWEVSENDYKKVEQSYMDAIKSQENYVAQNKIFEHAGQKLLLKLFIINETIFDPYGYKLAEFSILSLDEWAAVKMLETTTGFTPLPVSREGHSRKHFEI